MSIKSLKSISEYNLGMMSFKEWDFIIIDVNGGEGVQ